MQSMGAVRNGKEMVKMGCTFIILGGRTERPLGLVRLNRYAEVGCVCIGGKFRRKLHFNSKHVLT